ncbi:MAG: hypothetical protein ACRD2A_07700, partial [Vicinamibacterales bacterium]
QMRSISVAKAAAVVRGRRMELSLTGVDGPPPGISAVHGYNPGVRKIRGLLIGYAVIALFTGWPILSVVIAGTIASWNGCTLHEGFVNPCVVNGRDIARSTRWA